MSWTRYLNREWWTYQQIDVLDEKIRQRARDDSSARAHISDRVDALEDALERALLLVQALGETCVRKGVLSREEIAAVVAEIDLLDGQADGKLAMARPASSSPARPVPASEYLRKLESQDAPTPSEFLERLEETND